MEYKIIKNEGESFWEEKNKGLFGLKTKDGEISVEFQNNLIKIVSNQMEAFLFRDGKKAKVSVDGKKIKGMIKDGDRLYLANEVIIEFFIFKQKKVDFKMPVINWNLWAGIVILLFILIITFWGWKKNTEASIEKKYQQILLEINDNLKKSDEIKSIDSETSLKLLNIAKEKNQEIKSNKKHELETIEIEKIINEKLLVSGSSDVASFEEFYDTKIADTSDRKYLKINISGDVAVLTDIANRKIIQINLSSKQVIKHDINNAISNIVDVSLVNNKINIYDGKNILDLENNKITNDIDEVFVNTTNWNKSWYMLGQTGKIEKYSNGSATTWTNTAALLIDRPISMAIDGTVWVIGENREVLNYEKGIVKKWTPSLKINGEKVIGITTTAESNDVAIILDKKVLLFSKTNGKLMATYNFEKVGIIGGRMGNKNQIYILGNDQKIYKVK